MINPNLKHANFEVLREKFKKARPFPYMIIDDFLDEDYASMLFELFPKVTDEWYKYENPLEKKRATDKFELMPMLHSNLLQYMNSPKALKLIEDLTGLDGIIPDPYLRGGGLHAIEAGGHLGVHSDYPIHPKLGVYRRINVLIYLNKIWEEKWGGYLELWDKTMTSLELKIKPSFNRMVLFETNPDSFHGHPDPLACPSSVVRKSMALYYYHIEKPSGYEVLPKSTHFKRRPNDPENIELDQLREQRAKGRLVSNV